MSGEYEKVDRTPVEIPTRLRLPQSRTDQIRAFIREEISRKAEAAGVETFEEADDIEPNEDEGELPFSPYELNELEPPAAVSSSGAPSQPSHPPAKQAVSERSEAAPADPARTKQVPQSTAEVPHGPVP